MEVPRYWSRREAICHTSGGGWREDVFLAFVSCILDDYVVYPCPFAVAGVAKDQVRYLFLDGEDTIAVLAEQLAHYLSAARQIGPQTALVVFFEPQPVSPILEYHALLWRILRDLAAHDRRPWPSSIPKETNDPAFEFCFSGEPVFLMASTPAHVARRSRNAPTFTLTFQPGWAFDGLFANRLSEARLQSEVRRRLCAFEAVEPSPLLADAGVHHKFFLPDDNDVVMACPYRTLAKA